MWRVTGVAGALLVLLAVASGPVYALTERVAAQLATPEVYISRVLPQETVEETVKKVEQKSLQETVRETAP